MEAHLFFTGLVLLVCLVHVATAIGEMAGSFFDHPAAMENRSSPHETRDDWYVFFCCADLTGAVDWPPRKTAKNQAVAVDPINTTSKKKDARPRVYA